MLSAVHASKDNHVSFKKGDIVKCVTKDSTVLILGRIYTVERVSNNHVYLVTGGRGLGYRSDRFELVNHLSKESDVHFVGELFLKGANVVRFQTGDIIRCIDGVNSQAGDFFLETGKEYTVTNGDDARCVCIDNISYGYYRHRFVFVSRPCSCPANAFRCTCQPGV